MLKNNKQIAILIVSLLISATLQNQLESEIVTPIIGLYMNTGEVSNFFEFTPFQTLKGISKFVIAKKKEGAPNKADASVDITNNVIDQSADNSIVINALFDFAYQESYMTTVVENSWFTAPYMDLSFNGPVQNHKIFLFEDIQQTVQSFINQTPNMDVMTLLNTYGRMLLLVGLFNDMGGNYCNTLADGFVYTTDGKMRLYDYSGLSYGYCEKNANSYPSFIAKKLNKSIDSFGLTQALGNLFFNQVGFKKDELNSYTTADENVNEQLTSILMKNVSNNEQYRKTDGNYDIKRMYEDLTTHTIFKNNNNQEKLMIDSLCDEADPKASIEALFQTNAEQIQTCVMTSVTEEWCKNEEMKKNCADISSAETFYFEEDGFEELFCDHQSTITKFCKEKKNKKNFIKEVRKQKFFKSVCEDENDEDENAEDQIIEDENVEDQIVEDELTEEQLKQYCNTPSHQNICVNTLRVCKYIGYFQFSNSDKFDEWCRLEDKCPEKDVSWCLENPLTIYFFNNRNEFLSYCEIKNNYATEIQTKKNVVNTYHTMVTEVIPFLYNETYEDEISTFFQGKAGPTMKKILKKLFKEEMFKINERFLEVFSFLFIFSVMYEKGGPMEEPFNRLQPFGDIFKSCNMNKWVGTVNAASNIVEDDFTSIIESFVIGKKITNKVIKEHQFYKKLMSCKAELKEYLDLRRRSKTLKNKSKVVDANQAIEDFFSYIPSRRRLII